MYGEDPRPTDWTFYAKLPLIIIAGIGLVLAAIFILPFNKRFNLGGLLGGLFGKKQSHKQAIKAANLPPTTRLQSPGVPDLLGRVQVEVLPLDRSKNPFRDKSVVKLNDGEVIKLPEGVQDTDVQSLIIVSPTVTAVKLIDGPTKIPTKTSAAELRRKLQNSRKTGGSL